MKLRTILATVLAAAVIFMPQVAGAAGFDFLNGACTGNSGAATSSPTCQQAAAQKAAGTNPALDKIHTATNLIGLVAGVSSVIIIVYSGFQFATAGGSIGGQRSGDKVTKAKEARATLTGAITGLIIVALSWSIITFVTDKLIK